MQIAFDIGIVILAYIFGSIPFGLLIVKLKTGKDIREVESGRTGGTNAMRAAGFWAGFATALLDILKGAVGVWVAQWLTPDSQWVHVLSPIAAILGHNYSIFLAERDANGKFRLRGGAGGAPSVGGAMGLWPASILIILPLGMLTFFTIGIASITTMAVALFAIIVFAVRALLFDGQWIDVWYGVGAEVLLVWALRPNLKKLMEGNERIVKYSLNGWLKARREAKEESKQ
ncbi:MAG TPA: glycerol-3-phosphate acyltransferase [Anaerolineales bacterium]|nr:glycerol-3-phosphate acyltransferase [Anaerolineales bacterium]HQX01008.1 glycerol-3-phosphate acyltransferase [Anaerolineales bacterium]